MREALRELDHIRAKSAADVKNVPDAIERLLAEQHLAHLLLLLLDQLPLLGVALGSEEYAAHRKRRRPLLEGAKREVILSELRARGVRHGRIELRGLVARRSGSRPLVAGDPAAALFEGVPGETDATRCALAVPLTPIDREPFHPELEQLRAVALLHPSADQARHISDFIERRQQLPVPRSLALQDSPAAPLQIGCEVGAELLRAGGGEGHAVLHGLASHLQRVGDAQQVGLRRRALRDMRLKSAGVFAQLRTRPCRQHDESRSRRSDDERTGVAS